MHRVQCDSDYIQVITYYLKQVELSYIIFGDCLHKIYRVDKYYYHNFALYYIILLIRRLDTVSWPGCTALYSK